MSATFIEKIKNWIYYMASTPMEDLSVWEELLGCLVIAGVCGLIWLIGELVYIWEGKE